MSRVGKKAVAPVATMMCIVLALSIVGPLSEAQSTDTSPPDTTIQVSGTAGDNGWYKGTTTPTFTFTATDPGGSGVAHTYYHIDGGNDITYNGSSIPIPEGDHTIVYHSVDNAGNSEPVKALSIKVDTVLPTMNRTIIPQNPLDSGWYNSTVTVNLTASDNGSGISSISYSLDGNWKDYTGNFTVTHGSRTINYGCRDFAGNMYNNSVAINVFDPEITIVPSPNQWIPDQDSFLVSFIKPSDGITDHVEVCPDNKSWYRLDGSINISWEGNNTIYYRSISTQGVISSTRMVWFGLDNSPPTIGYSIDGSMSSKGYYEGDITVTLNTHDNAGINGTQWSWDKSTWYTYNGPFKLSPQKSKTLYYRTVDMGNHTADGHTFIYFKPTSLDQGSMSESRWVNGQLIGPSSGTGPDDETPTENPTPTRTPSTIPSPSPTSVPSPSPEAEGSNTPLAIGILVAVLVLIGLAAVAAYLFVFKPK